MVFFNTVHERTEVTNIDNSYFNLFKINIENARASFVRIPLHFSWSFGRNESFKNPWTRSDINKDLWESCFQYIRKALYGGNFQFLLNKN